MGCGNSRDSNQSNNHNSGGNNQLNVINDNAEHNHDTGSPNKRSNVYKILMIGDASVGKTSISSRWVDETFQNNYIATIGT